MTQKRGNVNNPGFFDILYLDENLLIIKQNEPGGIFINIRDTSTNAQILQSILNK